MTLKYLPQKIVLVDSWKHSVQYTPVSRENHFGILLYWFLASVISKSADFKVIVTKPSIFNPVFIKIHTEISWWRKLNMCSNTGCYFPPTTNKAEFLLDLQRNGPNCLTSFFNDSWMFSIKVRGNWLKEQHGQHHYTSNVIRFATEVL